MELAKRQSIKCWAMTGLLYAATTLASNGLQSSVIRYIAASSSHQTGFSWYKLELVASLTHTSYLLLIHSMIRMASSNYS